MKITEQQSNNNNNPAFTLIELLVVIAIIGILTALAVVSLQNSRRSARDAKRITDVKQMQIALELYYQDNSSYPSSLIAGESLSSNSITYMETIPQAPTPNDGDCSEEDNNYTYSTSKDNSYYTISFCLSSDISSLPAGEVIASPRGLGKWTCGEYLLDTRDYQSYTTIQFGDQCWMGENLNVGTRIDGVTTSTDNNIIEKYCYNNLESNCDDGYGGLYQWWEAMEYDENNIQGICPDGWHIATSGEWNILVAYINTNYPNYLCSGGNGKAFASNHDWTSTTALCAVGNNQQVNNTTGFNVLPAGYRANTNGSFVHRGVGTYIWSSIFGSEVPEGRAGYRYLQYLSTNFGPSSDYYAYGLPVRCLKD